MAVQMRTMLEVADNSGARKLQMILPLGGGAGKVAHLGDVFTASVKEAAPDGTAKKGTATPAPAETTNDGRSRRSTSTARPTLRIKLPTLRVVGENDRITRSPARRSATSEVSGQTQTWSRGLHQSRRASSYSSPVVPAVMGQPAAVRLRLQSRAATFRWMSFAAPSRTVAPARRCRPSRTLSMRNR